MKHGGIIARCTGYRQEKENNTCTKNDVFPQVSENKKYHLYFMKANTEICKWNNHYNLLLEDSILNLMIVILDNLISKENSSLIAILMTVLWI